MGLFCFLTFELFSTFEYIYSMSTISTIHARQILDSRGNPTVEVEVTLDDGSFGRASVPSGSSTGSHEARELRDHGKKYQGQSVETAINFVNSDIAEFLKNNDPLQQIKVYNEMVLQDGTPNLQHFGANAILGVSLAISKAAAASLKIPYYQYISQLFAQISLKNEGMYQLPRPMFNIMNGGTHTNWQTTDIQEFMIVPLTAMNFSEALRWGDEIYQALKSILKEKGYSTMVGDEGGFAPTLRNDEEAVELILMAIQRAGYNAGTQVGLAIDAAATQFWTGDHYQLRIQKKSLTTEEMIAYWLDWTKKYPIMSLEDCLAEDDWQGWTTLSHAVDSHIQIVGDDLLVTNIDRIKEAIDKKACNCLLMKPNQIGTLTESLQAIATAQDAGWGVVVSHRSGETEDTSIADIAVGTNAGQIKTGAPSRTERLAKYNQLLRIEEELSQKH